MSYEVFITRADVSWETAENPLSESEWLAVANASHELETSKANFYSRKNDDGEIEKYHPWLITSLPNKPPLWFIDGAINTDNPDIVTIKEMVVFSKILNAKVIGEEGEVYNENGEAIFP